jgi:hypothetical protein
MYWESNTQKFIDDDMHHPQKKWIQHIIEGVRETDKVRYQDDDMIIIPDYKNIYKRLHKRNTHFQYHRKGAVSFNWMVILKDEKLRNLRDLRAYHVELLQKVKSKSIEILQTEFPQISKEDVMIFANYPPSVHRLHFHLCFPFFFANAYDAFRIHPIDQIINNLQINSEYYFVSSFTIPLYENSSWTKLYHTHKKEKHAVDA